MAASGNSRANANRKIRQEALREQLEAQGHHQHVTDIIDKLRNLDEDLDSLKIQRLRAAADLKMKLIDKYLPTEKPVEHSGEINTGRADDLTDDQLISIASGSSTGATKQKDSEKKPSRVH